MFSWDFYEKSKNSTFWLKNQTFFKILTQKSNYFQNFGLKNLLFQIFDSKIFFTKNSKIWSNAELKFLAKICVRIVVIFGSKL